MKDVIKTVGYIAAWIVIAFLAAVVIIPGRVWGKIERIGKGKRYNGKII